MTVAIHPSEARPRSPQQRASSRLRLPLLAGVGLLALGAFAAGSFSFFSNLADPRIKPRTSVAAAAWPDLKDGVPALAEPARAPVPNLPRPTPSEPERAAGAPPAPAAEPVLRTEGVRTATETPPVAGPGREAKRTPPIENAATLPVPGKPVALVAPRAVAAIAPARAETVKAKPAQPSRFVSLTADGGKAEAGPQKTKPAAPKTAAQARTSPQDKAPAPKLVAEAQPAPAAAAPEEPEVMGVRIPGGRHIRDGLQAVGNLFGSASDSQ